MRKSLRFMSMLLATAFVMLGVFIIQPAFAFNTNILTPAYGAPDFGQSGLFYVNVQPTADIVNLGNYRQPVIVGWPDGAGVQHKNYSETKVSLVSRTIDLRREIRQFRPEVTYPRMPYS